MTSLLEQDGHEKVIINSTQAPLLEANLGQTAALSATEATPQPETQNHDPMELEAVSPVLIASPSQHSGASSAAAMMISGKVQGRNRTVRINGGPMKVLSGRHILPGC